MSHATGQALLQLEQGHLRRLAIWALLSLAVGLVLVVIARRRHPSHAAWLHAGIQCASWGAVDLIIAAAAWPGLRVRTLPEAIALDRFLWLNIGLDVGYALVGATLVILGSRAPRRPGLVGAGFAVIVQGLVLAALDAKLSADIVR